MALFGLNVTTSSICEIFIRRTSDIEFREIFRHFTNTNEKTNMFTNSWAYALVLPVILFMKELLSSKFLRAVSQNKWFSLFYLSYLYNKNPYFAREAETKYETNLSSYSSRSIYNKNVHISASKSKFSGGAVGRRNCKPSTCRLALFASFSTRFVLPRSFTFNL